MMIMIHESGGGKGGGASDLDDAGA